MDGRKKRKIRARVCGAFDNPLTINLNINNEGSVESVYSAELL
jgi:hypothetical protein